MRMNGNTILISGGGSGIGRALAEKFHALGNIVIIAGRNMNRLNDVVSANPGMIAVELNMADADAIKAFAAQITVDYPALNVVINNAGMMAAEAMKDAPSNLPVAEDSVATNLLGPIRLSSALLPHLMQQSQSAIMATTSGLAFVPLAIAPAYSATKAGLHSWLVATRVQLKGTAVQVIELAPPYVQTELMSAEQASDPHAMPLAAFIDESIALLAGDPDIEEVIVENCKPLRFAAENGNMAEIMGDLNSAFS